MRAWPRVLAPATTLWLWARRRSADYVRSAPVTYGYLAILCLTTWILAGLGDRVADRLLLAQSTNLHHLGHDPAWVLFSSAFWAPGEHALIISAVLFTIVLAPVERRIGSLRTIGVFAIGHIGATLITAAGLWVALRFDAVERNVVNARDVGPSYGFFAVAAAMTYLVARELRAPYAAALTGYLAASAVLSGGLGDSGHLTAAALGLASFPLARHATGPTTSPLMAGLPRRWAAMRSRGAAPVPPPTRAGHAE